MANTNKYFTYQRRDVDKSTINWAGIGKEISDNITSVQEKRESQREQIQKNHLDAISKMNTYEQGLNTGINEFMAKQANNSKNYLHQQYKMMKNGVVDPSDYNVAKVKLSETYKVLNDTVKTFNDKYATALEEGSEGSLFLAEEAATIFDFKNRELYINPDTHEAYLARVDADGNMDEKSLKPVRALANNQNFIWEGFSPEEEVTDKLSGLAQWKRIYSSGASVSNLRNNPKYDRWKKSTIGSFTSKPRKAASVLTEGLGGYSYTRDEKEASADPMKILIKDNADGVPSPELTEEQMTEAKDYLNELIEVRIGFGQKDKQSDSNKRIGRTDQRLVDNYAVAFNATSSDPQKAEAALEQIIRTNRNISDIISTGTGANKSFSIIGNDGQVVDKFKAVYVNGKYDQIATTDKLVTFAEGMNQAGDVDRSRDLFLRQGGGNITTSNEPGAQRSTDVDTVFNNENNVTRLLSGVEYDEVPELEGAEGQRFVNDIIESLVDFGLIPEGSTTTFNTGFISDDIDVKDPDGNVIFNIEEGDNLGINSDVTKSLRERIRQYNNRMSARGPESKTTPEIENNPLMPPSEK